MKSTHRIYYEYPTYNTMERVYSYTYAYVYTLVYVYTYRIRVYARLCARSYA